MRAWYFQSMQSAINYYSHLSNIPYLPSKKLIFLHWTLKNELYRSCIGRNMYAPTEKNQHFWPLHVSTTCCYSSHALSILLISYCNICNNHLYFFFFVTTVNIIEIMTSVWSHTINILTVCGIYYNNPLQLVSSLKRL